jgi:hypothetical protein
VDHASTAIKMATMSISDIVSASSSHPFLVACGCQQEAVHRNTFWQIRLPTWRFILFRLRFRWRDWFNLADQLPPLRLLAAQNLLHLLDMCDDCGRENLIIHRHHRVGRISICAEQRVCRVAVELRLALERIEPVIRRKGSREGGKRHRQNRPQHMKSTDVRCRQSGDAGGQYEVENGLVRNYAVAPGKAYFATGFS